MPAIRAQSNHTELKTGLRLLLVPEANLVIQRVAVRLNVCSPSAPTVAVDPKQTNAQLTGLPESRSPTARIDRGPWYWD